MTSTANPTSSDVKSAVRVVQIFQLFAELRQPASLTVISERLSLPKSSCLGLLKTLESNGYLYQVNATKDYYPTRRLYDESRTIVDSDPLLRHLRPLMEELSQATRETVFLAKRFDLQSHYIEVIESGQTLRFAATAGEKRPLYIGAAGLSLLGGMDDVARDVVIGRMRFEKFSSKTVKTGAKLKQMIQEGKARGWFVSMGAYQAGVSSIGNYVYLNGEIYAIVVAAPTERLEKNQKRIAAAVIELTRRLSSMPFQTPLSNRP